MLVEAGGEFPRRSVYQHDRSALSYPDHSTKPAINANDIVDVEPEPMWVRSPDKAEKWAW
jgi:hypothetical protein